jgi:beta-glucanase (GH16 family)
MHAGNRTTVKLALAVALIATALSAVPGPAAQAAPPVGPDKLADFEGGLPPGWFTYGGASTVTTTSQTVGDGDALARPAQSGDNDVLEVFFDVTDFGGFGTDLTATVAPQDWSQTDGLSFWFRGTDSDLVYQAEIQDNRSNPAIDTAERFDVEFTDDTAGWKRIFIPWGDFTRATDFQPAGAPVDGLTLTEMWGWAIVLPIGSGTVYFDDFGLENHIIDDFESGIAPAAPCPPGAPPLGFCTFNGAGSSVALSNPASPPAPVLFELGTPNSVLQMDVDVTSFAGFIHGFSNAALDTWIPQDWSASEGISLWLHGTGSGTSLFIDLLDNRNPGSTSDDAERWTVAFVDDFVGWQYFEFPFSSFSRKDIGNSAPNDGLGLFEMHGWALGTLDTGGPLTYHVDQVSLYGIGELPAPTVQFATQNTFIPEGTTGDIAVKLNRPLGPDDPAQVSIDFATERSNATPGEDFTPTSGTLTFVNGGPSELSFPIETFDDTKFEGDEQIVIRLTNPVDIERGAPFQGSALIEDDDPFDPDLLDDFVQGAFLWDTEGPVELDAVDIALGDPDERPGQNTVEETLSVSTPAAGPAFDAQKQAVIADLQALLPASSEFATERIEKAITRIEQSLDPDYWINGFILDPTDGKNVFNRERKAVVELLKIRGPEAAAAQAAINALVGVDEGLASTAIAIAELNGGTASDIAKARKEMGKAEAELAKNRPDRAIIRYRQAWYHATKSIKNLNDLTLGSVGRDFALGQDWTDTESLDFWFNGTGSGEDITVTLKDNRAPDPGPSGWNLVWSDEFDGPAGAPPNPANWAYEIGDTTPDGKNGWGNEELQYYTDDPDNASTDGLGNLVITLDEADGSQECYYGPCEYESARLLTQNRAEFAYGRIESRLLVPDGGDGLWPAFWSLGTDITYNPWPGAGEIDFMEYVSRLPNEIFGTIHGPGYSGGGSFGGIWDFGEPVFNGYHTFTVEWEPNLITWYVDGIQYHQAEPSDVPGPWVFDKPFFLLLNFAIGGNFGGPVDPGNTYPQEYLVDYVRVYQGPDTAERFEASFTDAVDGWQQVSIPITDFVRGADQPDGAPDDGLTLTDVWGYGFDLPYPVAGTYLIDQVRRVEPPPPPNPVFDDFEDGDAGDWIFFGGNGAGGGGGAADDRPAVGDWYFSTGWGGNGTASSFYGGAFRNVETADQATPPADPWFNVWVLNQSDATVDSYTLEITIREDLDGNGWTNGSEDSFRLDTGFTSAEFDDEWTLVSAPLTSFINLGTGGDGIFNGKLDEVVIVISNVQGGSGSTVELDFDQFAFSSGGPLDPSP